MKNKFSPTRQVHCPTCNAPGKLTRIRNVGCRTLPNKVGFICSKDSTHWEIFSVDEFRLVH